MSVPRIAIAYEDDWKAVYIDGKLVEQHHSFTPRQVLDMLGIPCEHINAEGYLHPWKRSYFPDTLEELQAWDGVPLDDEDDE